MSLDVLSDIKVLLAGVTSDVYGEFPSDKDNCISVSHTGGFSPEHTFGKNTKAVLAHPSFQIKVRHMSEASMHDWWEQIKTALDGLTEYTPINTSRTYLFIEQQGDVLDLGRDNNRRHIQALNFNTTIINS